MTGSTGAWAVGTGALAWLLTLVVMRLAPSLRLVDRPDGALKHHARPVPIAGGIAVFVAIHLGTLVTDTFDAGLFAATAILLAVGLYDDLRTMSPGLRLAVEAGAGLVLWLFADFPMSGALWALLTVVVVVVTVNAVNLLDGADGVASGAVLVSAAGLAAITLGRDVDATVAALAAAATAGFLVVNWPPARAYLGDGGAYVLGGVLAYLVLGSHQETSASEQLAAIAVAAGALGVLLLDLAVTFLRRRLAGAPMFIGDRSHLYDQLADRGWPPARVAIGVALGQACFALACYGVDRLVGGWPAVGWLVAGFLLVLIVLWRAGFVVPDGARPTGHP